MNIDKEMVAIERLIKIQRIACIAGIVVSCVGLLVIFAAQLML